MTNSIITSIEFVLNVLVGLYLLLLLLRLVLPWVGANFHNPLAQGILKATSPLVVPVRRILPPFGRIDTATVVVAFGIQYLLIWLLGAINGAPASIVVIAVNSIFALTSQLLRLFMYAIFIRIILSWISPGNYNPAIEIIAAITEPVMRPFRRIIPPMGGFDISPIFAMLTLGVLMILIGGVQVSLLETLR
jgi:YggT family protein